MARQRPNVFWMEQMGATVVPVEKGQKTLTPSTNVCVTGSSMEDSHYALGTACGFHPFRFVSYFQKVIGQEAVNSCGVPGRLTASMHVCGGLTPWDFRVFLKTL